MKPDFPETGDVPPLADAMVALERTHDHVKQIAANDWKPLPKHPDIDPAHEVLLLREHYTELLRADDVPGQPAEFQKLMHEGEAAAIGLERAMTEADYTAAGQALTAINQNCASCHQQFRDVPLGER